MESLVQHQPALATPNLTPLRSVQCIAKVGTDPPQHRRQQQWDSREPSEVATSGEALGLGGPARHTCALKLRESASRGRDSKATRRGRSCASASVYTPFTSSSPKLWRVRGSSLIFVNAARHDVMVEAGNHVTLATRWRRRGRPTMA